MKIEEKWVWPASLDDVYAMLVDPEFQEAKCRATKAVEHDVSIDPQGDGDGRTITTHRTMSTASFPPQFKSMVGDALHITETQAWGQEGDDGTRTAALRVEISGLPISLRGTITASPSSDGSGTVMDMAGDLKAKIPVFGGRVEQAAAPGIVAAIETEAETGRDYLAG